MNDDGVELIGGKEPRQFVLEEYSREWPARFEQERTRIARALGPLVSSVEHIGSTSVPGLAAKPIIDICVTVPDADDEAAFAPQLVAADYELRVREPGHRMFRTPGRTAHVHVWSEGDPEIDAVLLFREWLRTHPDDRVRYESVKRELITREWGDMQDYADAKTDIVSEIMRRARCQPSGG